MWRSSMIDASTHKYVFDLYHMPFYLVQHLPAAVNATSLAPVKSVEDMLS